MSGVSPAYGIDAFFRQPFGLGMGEHERRLGRLQFAHTSFACTPTYTCNGNIIQNSCDSSQNVTCTAPTFCSPGVPVCLFPPPQDTSLGNGHSGHLEVAAKPHRQRRHDQALLEHDANVQTAPSPAPTERPGTAPPPAQAASPPTLSRRRPPSRSTASSSTAPPTPRSRRSPCCRCSRRDNIACG